MIKSIEDLLREEEDVKRSAYQDSNGFWTIGVGRLIDERKGGGLSSDEIAFLLDNDIKERTELLDRDFEWFQPLDEVRQAVVISMMFQVGSLDKWPKFCSAMADGDYDRAAKEMLNSRVAREQAPRRWERQAKMMESGLWQ